MGRAALLRAVAHGAGWMRFTLFGMILGAFVGVAAIFGAAMNFNFMLAGTASTNPLMFLLAVLLIMAWKTAGYYGLDRFLLPILGTPWQPIPIKQSRKAKELPAAA